MDKHPINNRLGLDDKIYRGSQSFRKLGWSPSSISEQSRRDLLLSQSCRFNSETMKSVYKSIQSEEMEYNGIEDIDDLNSQHPDVMEKVNDQFEEVLDRCKENSGKMSEINNVLSN